MTERTKNRLAALRSKMAEHGVDLVALGPGPHMHWVMGFHPHPDERPCLLLVGKQKEAFLMPVLNAEGSRQSTDIASRTLSVRCRTRLLDKLECGYCWGAPEPGHGNASSFAAAIMTSESAP